ncbi:MAG: DedA family protein [Thermoleophilia bacterium]|nr:DedA family protein [Thermoleophilia bacterium]
MLDSLLDLLAGSPVTYLVIVGLVAGDALVPLVPGESSVVVGAVLAADGRLEVWLVLLAAWLGAVIGDVTMYGIGRVAGTRVVERIARGEKGARRVGWAAGQLDRRGTGLIVGAQFVPGGRNVVMLTAGALAYPLLRFLPAQMAGALLWAVAQTAIGYLGGRAFEGTWTALLVSLAVAVALAVGIEGAGRVVRRVRRTAAPSSAAD